MSSLMMLSIKEKKQILADTVNDKKKKLHILLQELRHIVRAHPFLASFEDELNEVEETSKRELDSITLHDVDYEKHQRKANDVEVRYTKKLLELKSKIISKRDKTLAIIKQYKILDTRKYIEDFLPDLQDELHMTLELVKALDEEEANRITQLSNSLELKLKEAKVTYLKLLDTAVYKEDIHTRYSTLTSDEQKIASQLLDQRILEKSVYESFIEQHINTQQSKELSVIQESFEALGYTFDTPIESNALVHINTAEQEYKIALRVVDGKISLAFTRLILKGSTVSEYEKAKDLSFAKKWCDDLEKIKQLLSQQGMHVQEEMRLEPTIENIRYEEVDSIDEIQNISAYNIEMSSIKL